ncbi:30S ribosomal protein S17 [Sulfidibacter corallicola]|uniref:Small ribosomal subunit protein uS17 n=1 Tax=Sulfidibacter corallicola TaxID=2818388 RepID=A0A8A4TGE5_SULCO|nr:30S ribosomal protein S17 [Sulfidibacter corallicola]QTD47861.1 30S ribosomal protein S17 [Sulfidibacter corallicola]
MENNRGQRVKKVGIVVSDKMDKTIVVRVEQKYTHPLYKRTVKKSKKFKAHDEAGTAKTGDRVEIIESRPLSKSKTWRLVRVLDK